MENVSREGRDNPKLPNQDYISSTLKYHKSIFLPASSYMERKLREAILTVSSA